MNRDVKTILFDFLGCKENYEVPEKLLHVVLSDERNELIEQLLKDHSGEADILRDYFQDNQSERRSFMQDYTPDSICELLSRIVEPSDYVMDMCSGTGALTISVVNKDKAKKIQCAELSNAAIPFLLLNLSIKNVDAEVVRKDIVSNQVFTRYKVTKGDKYGNIKAVEELEEEMLFDTVISNPPYSLTYVPDKDDKRFGEFDAPPKSKADYLFVLEALHKLKDNGKAYFIYPTGVLFRGGAEQKIRKKLIEKNYIEAVISLPGNMFFNTQIPVVIMVLNKERTTDDVLLIDASEACTKEGKFNRLEEEHIQKIVSTYKNRANMERFSRIVSKDEIAANDYNLNLPRYVDTAEEPEPIDMQALYQEIQQLNEESGQDFENIKDSLALIYGEENRSATNELFDCIEEQKKIQQEFVDLYYDFINNMPAMFYDYEYKKLLDLADIERARKGVVYPAGTILIQVSATHGQVLFLHEPQEVETKYAVVFNKKDSGVDSYYLYSVIGYNIQDFMTRYCGGINIQMDQFKWFQVPIYKDIRAKKTFSKMMESLDKMILAEETILGTTENVRNITINDLFV